MHMKAYLHSIGHTVADRDVGDAADYVASPENRREQPAAVEAKLIILLGT